jgi:hypothetical protein
MTDDAGTLMMWARVARLCRRGAEKNFSADAGRRCTQNTQMATESRLHLWLDVGNACLPNA